MSNLIPVRPRSLVAVGTAATAIVAPVLGSAQTAAFDAAGAVAEIDAARAPIIAIGTAVVGVAVVMMIFSMIRRML